MEKGDGFNDGELVVETLRQEICFSALSNSSRSTRSKTDAPSYFLMSPSSPKGFVFHLPWVHQNL